MHGGGISVRNLPLRNGNPVPWPEVMETRAVRNLPLRNGNSPSPEAR